MARVAIGDDEILKLAKSYLNQVSTIGELRQVQAVIFPLEYGFSIEKTALALGVSARWVSQLRTRFMRERKLVGCDQSSHGGRRRENLSDQEERVFLSPFLKQVKEGKPLVVAEVKLALDAKLGRTSALASIYNMLHRHGWSKAQQGKRSCTEM